MRHTELVASVNIKRIRRMKLQTQQSVPKIKCSICLGRDAEWVVDSVEADYDAVCSYDLAVVINNWMVWYQSLMVASFSWWWNHVGG